MRRQDYFDAIKRKSEQVRKEIILNSFQTRYDQLANEFNNNSEKLQNYSAKWADAKTSDEQKIYYLDLRKKQKALIASLDSAKDDYVSQFGEESFNQLRSSVERFGKNIKKVRKRVNDIAQEYSMYKSEDEHTSAVKNFNAQKKYGTTLDFDTWKKANDEGDDSQFVSSYAKSQGYKDNEFAKKYVDYTKKKIEELKKHGYVNSNKGYYSAATQSYQYYREYAKQSEIDKLENELSEFNKLVADKPDTNAVKSKSKQLRSNKDYKTLTSDVDYDSYFRGMNLYSYDKYMGGGRTGDYSGTWLEDMPENFLADFGEISNVNFSALSKAQKQDLAYLSKKVGEKKREFNQKVINGEFNVPENSFNDAEEQYLRSYVEELSNYIKTIEQTDGFQQKNEAENYKALKYGSGRNKFFTSGMTVFAKPTADFLSTVGIGADLITKGKIDTNSSWHALSNEISSQRSAMTEGVTEKHGTIGGLAFSGALSLADMMYASVVGGGFGASAPSVIMSTGAFANTTLDAKKRGVSDGVSILLGGIAGIAEYFTERMSFGRFFDALEGVGDKSIKNAFVNILKNGVKAAPKEALEEGLTSYINNIADTFLAGDKSNLKQNIVEYQNNGYDEKDAMKQALFDNFIKQPVQEAAVGGVIGFLMGSGGSVANYASVSNYINSESAQNYAKGRLLNNNYQSVVEKAKQFGASTKAFENAMAEVEQIANSDYVSESTRELRYARAFKKAQTEFLRLEYCANSMEAASKESIDNSTDKTTDKSKIDSKKLFGKLLGGKNVGAVENSSETNVEDGASAQRVDEAEGLDTNSGLVENNQSAQFEQSNVSGPVVNDGAVVNNVIRSNYKLAKVSEVAKSETAKADLINHVDDVQYTNVYNKYVNVEENNPSTASGPPSLNKDGEGGSSAQGYSLEERAEEFNRIYDYGVEEDVSAHEVESDIFTAEQIREIYAAGVVDDNSRLGHKLDYNEILKELETSSKIESFVDDTVKGILTAGAEDVKAAAKKLNIKVEFVDRVPGNDPNAPGAYVKSNNTIYINKNTKYPMQQVFLHELTHYFETAKNYIGFQDTVFESKAFKKWLNTSTDIKPNKYKDIDDFRHEIAKQYDSADEDEINREIVAYFVSDNLFQKEFGDLGRLATEVKDSIKERFISFIKNIFRKFSNAIKGINKLEKKFLKLYDSATQNKNTDRNDGVKQMKDIDSESVKSYNNDKGGVNNEESSDSKLLEGRTISTVSGNKDDLRKQSTNSQKMAEYVELYDEGNGRSGKIIAGESGFLVMEEKIPNYTKTVWGQRRHFESYVRNLSRIILKKTDTVGRKLSKDVIEKFKDTVFKTEDGTILSLFHWTNAIFKQFGKGDIGFHLGILDATNNIAFSKRRKYPDNKTSIFKETYVNITNPIFIYSDIHYWDSLPFLKLLLEHNYITNEEIDLLCEGDLQRIIGKSYGSEEVEKIIGFLEEKGYDGVIYENEVEGGYSVIAFHPEQIYTVAENGIDIEHEAEPKDSAFSNAENFNDKEYNDIYVESVKKHFGVTYSWNETGYLLADGSRLDFSGKNMGARGGSRTVDHREINQFAFEEDNEFNLYLQDLEGSEKITDFLNRGNIRINPETAGIELSVKPTEQQITQLKNFISRNYGEVTLDISDEKGSVVASLEYPKYIKSDVVINDIIDYFDKGRVPQKFEIQNMLDLNPEGFQDDGSYFDVDEDGELTWMSAEDTQRYLRRNYKSAVLDRRQIDLKAKSLLKQHQSRMDSEEVAVSLLNIYEDIKNIDKTGKHAKPKVDALAQKIFDNIVEEVTKGDMYGKLLDFFKNRGIRYNPKEMKEAFSDDWSSFIRKYRVKLNLQKRTAENGHLSTIEEVYDELCREFGGMFSGRHDGPRAQLEEMASVLNSQETMYDTFLEDNKEDVVQNIINDIYTGFYDVDFVDKKTEKAKVQKEYKFEKNSYIESDNVLDEKRFKTDERKRINAESKEYVNKQTDLYKNGEISAEKFAKRLTEHFSRVSSSAKIKPLDTYYRELNKYKERYKIINDKITKSINELRTMSEHPTEGKYIPLELVDLVQSVITLGENKNFDMAGRLKRYKDALSAMDYDDGIMSAYSEAISKMEEDFKGLELGKLFSQISQKYQTYQKDSEFGGLYHQAVADKLIEVASVLEKADITQLRMREAEALQEGLNCVTHFVKNYIKTDQIQKGTTIHEIASNIINESKAEGSDKRFQKFVDKGILTLLNPERFFNALGGWKHNSYCSKIGRFLNEGQTKSLQVKARLNNVVAPLLEGDNFYKAQRTQDYKKNLVDIGLVDENGNAVKIPKDFAITVFLHLQNEQNQKHALGGGFKIPNFKMYHNNSVTQGFDNGQRVWFNDIYESMRKIQDVLDDYDRLVIRTAKELFNKHTKAEYNSTTLKVFGFKKARVNNYFPLYTDKNFTQTDFSFVYDSTLKSQGNMQERKNASNPIMLMGIFDIIGKEIERCGEYCGKVEAEIVFNRVYNSVLKNFESSVKETLSENAKSYIEHFMQDYSGTRATENSPRLNKLRSNVATSALLLNLNVPFKQFSSYPSAAAVVGFKPLVKAFATDGEGRYVVYRANKDLINKYSAYYKIRFDGYSSQETVDLRNNSFYEKRSLKWLFGWIQAADTTVVGRLWYAAEHYVSDNTDLKKGSDEYYKEVGKVFDRIVLETQDNYTVMQRPDILRNPNAVVKSMVMFMTQPLQQFGTLYESTGNLIEQQRAYKAGEIDKSVLKDAQKREALAITSVMISMAMCSVMAFLAKALKGELDDYTDKYGEVNAGGVLKGIGIDLLNNIFGMVPFGNTVYQTVISVVSDKNYYGLSVANIDLINDALESAVDLGQWFFDEGRTKDDLMNKLKKLVLKCSAAWGIPARNATKLFNGFANLIKFGDYYANDELKSKNKYYAQMYDCIISSDDKKYNELFIELINKGESVNEIESGIKKYFKEAEAKDLKEAAQALVDEDYKLYNDIIDELKQRGFDVKIIISSIDEIAEKLKVDENDEETKVKAENSKYIYMKQLVDAINIKGLSNAELAKAQEYAEKVAEEYANYDINGDTDSETYAKAIEYDKSGRFPIEYFVIGKAITSTKFADKDGNGYVSNDEKYKAINNSKIPNDVKSILRQMDIL